MQWSLDTVTKEYTSSPCDEQWQNYAVQLALRFEYAIIFSLIHQSEKRSTSQPPAKLPMTLPMIPGILVRPLIISDQSNGGS